MTKSLRFALSDMKFITSITEFSKGVTVQQSEKEWEKDYSEYFAPMHLGVEYIDIEIENNPNARKKEKFGCVLVKVSEYHLGRRRFFKGSVFISVKDVSGIQRFPRSFSIYEGEEPQTPPQDPEEHGLPHFIDKWCIISYIKRETLLADAQELLPNDTLTLEIEIKKKRYIERDMLYFSDIAYPSLVKERNSKGMFEYYLLLDSPLVKIVSKESFFFQRLLDTPMLERSTRRMKISEFEYSTFNRISEMLLCDTHLILNNIRNIFEMYYVADKYGISVVIETCIAFLKLCLSDHSPEELWRLSRSMTGTMAINVYNLLSQVCSEVPEGNERNFSSVQRVGNSKWIYKGRKFHDEYGKTGILFENLYKSDFHFYK